MSSAYGHESQIIDGNGGNIQVVVGWKIEPPLRDELNEIQLQFQNLSVGEPITNAVEDLDVSIARGALLQ
ncbi:MAG: hypothetical protein ACREBU_04430 [Nitrososphaera sp.]